MSNDDIVLGGGTGPRRPPAISLPVIGSYVDVAVIDEDGKVPAYKFGTRERATRQDGTPKTKAVVTVLVIRGTGTIKDLTLKEGEQEREVRAGDVCTIHFEGQNRWDPDHDKTRAKGELKSWSGAKEDLGRQLQVGDVFRWLYEKEVPGKGAQPRRFRLVQLRAPRPEEAAQTDRCKELYREQSAQPVGALQGELDPF